MVEQAEPALLLDEGLPYQAAALLRQHGIETRHVMELNLQSVADETILAAAVERHATVVSLDSDFHRLLAKSQASAPSVIRIRLEGLDGSAAAELLLEVITKVRQKLERGAVITVDAHTIRGRLLPL
jgi:predicted nuclease of predicted toxin-antitoxin system